MAKEKKSFIAYADWIELFTELSDEEAGRLVKHLFQYVNDMDVEAPDKLTKMCFIPIKQALKRDLKTWINSKEEKSIAGIKGNLKRWNFDLYEQVMSDKITLEEAQSIAEHRRTSQPDKVLSQNIAKITVNDNVNVNVNVNDNVIKEKKEKAFNFRLSLIDLGVNEKIVEDWMKVRKTKNATNTETAFNKIKSQIEKSGKTANECITLAVEKDWKGFEAEWIKNNNSNYLQKEQPASHVHTTKKETIADFGWEEFLKK